MSFTFSTATSGQVNGEITVEKTYVQTDDDRLERFEFSSHNSVVQHVEIDTILNRVYVISRLYKRSKPKKEGFLTAYDLSTDKVEWTSEFVFPDNLEGAASVYRTDSRVVLLVLPGILYGLEEQTGKSRYTVYSSHFLVHPKGSMILANHFSGKTSRLNPITGEEIWRNKFNLIDTRNAHFTSDSCVMAIENGIHHINLHSGNSWYRKIKSLHRYKEVGDVTRNSIITSSTIMFGLVGALVSSLATSGMTNSVKVGNKSTNYLFEDNLLYVAAEDLAKIDHGNNTIWTAGELERKRGKSVILSLNEEDCLLIDYGYKPNSEAVKVRSGDASCEFYKKQTGELLRGVTLQTEGNDYIRDFVLDDQKISFLGNRSLFRISLETLEKTKTKEFGDGYSNIGLSTFVDPNDYVRVEERFVRLSEIMDDKLYIKNTSSKVAVFDEDMELSEIHPSADFYDETGRYAGMTLIKNDDESVLISVNGEKAIEESFSPSARISDEYLVDHWGKKLRIIRLQ